MKDKQATPETTFEGTEPAPKPLKFETIAATLDAVCAALGAARLRMQEMIQKIHAESCYEIPLAQQQQACLTQALEFRLGISDLGEKFWASSGSLEKQCADFRERLGQCAPWAPVATPDSDPLAVLEQTWRLNHHASILFAQISLIHQSIELCEDIFLTIFDRQPALASRFALAPEQAIEQLLAEKWPLRSSEAGRQSAATILAMRVDQVCAENVLKKTLRNKDFPLASAAIRYFEKSTQALYARLGELEPAVPGQQ